MKVYNQIDKLLFVYEKLKLSEFNKCSGILKDIKF